MRKYNGSVNAIFINLPHNSGDWIDSYRFIIYSTPLHPSSVDVDVNSFAFQRKLARNLSSWQLAWHKLILILYDC